jgi:hypothetical protein
VFELADVIDADVAPDEQRVLVARETAPARLGQKLVALGAPLRSAGGRSPRASWPGKGHPGLS